MPLLRDTLRATDLTRSQTHRGGLLRLRPQRARRETRARDGPLQRDQQRRRPGRDDQTDALRQDRRNISTTSTDMTKRFGIKSRGIMELTGKASLRAFKTSFKLIEWAAEGLYALITWIAGLIAMILMRGVRIFGRRRAATHKKTAPSREGAV